MKVQINRKEFLRALKTIDTARTGCNEFNRKYVNIYWQTQPKEALHIGSHLFSHSKSAHTVTIRLKHTVLTYTPLQKLSFNIEVAPLKKFLSTVKSDLICMETTGTDAYGNTLIEFDAKQRTNQRQKLSMETCAQLAPDTAPRLPEHTLSNVINVHGDDVFKLKHDLKLALMAAANNDPRVFFLNGVFFEFMPATGKLNFTGTDGYRIHSSTGGKNKQVSSSDSHIIPRDVAHALLLLAENSNSLFYGKPYTTSAYHVWNGPGWTLIYDTKNMLEYPDYSKIFPAKENRTLSLNISAANLKLAIKSANIDAKNGAVILSADFNRHMGSTVLEVTQKANLREATATATLPVIHAFSHNESCKMRVALNTRFLLDALHLEKEEADGVVYLEYYDELMPFLVRPAYNGDDVRILMPIIMR